MKRLIRGLTILLVMVSCFVCLSLPARALNLTNLAQSSTLILAETQRVNPADAKLSSEYGQKIDLNNANVRMFRQFPGFYPTLASKIVVNAPYNAVEDVLNIPGLSEKQKARLQANLDQFTVTAPADVFIEGGDRFNPGVY